MHIKKEVSNVVSLYDYYEALDYCKEFFADSLKEYKISLVVLFGSATYPGCFGFETSDLDIIALTDLVEDNLDAIAKEITKKVDFSGSYKMPIVIKDQIGARIEFLLPHGNVSIDCTIMSSLFADRMTLMETAVYDSADLLMGAVVERGIVIAGDKTKLKQIGSQFEPYYDDELRKRRLVVLAKYLQPKVARMKELLKNDSPELVDYFFRYRVAFLKYIFCFCKKYPVNYHKHLEYQASEILKLSENDKNILLLRSRDKWRDSIGDFIEMYERCLSCG
jgi:hypothetical protein